MFQPAAVLFREVFGCGDHAGEGTRVFFLELPQLAVEIGAHGVIALFQHIIDHALQAHVAPIIRGVDTGDTIVVQLLDFFRQNGTAPASEELNVAGAPLLEQVMHVLKELGVPTLIGGNGDALRIFHDGSIYNFLYGAVVAEVDDFSA